MRWLAAMTLAVVGCKQAPAPTSEAVSTPPITPSPPAPTTSAPPVAATPAPHQVLSLCPVTSHHGHPILLVGVEPTCGAPAVECTTELDEVTGDLEISLRFVGDAVEPCAPGKREFGTCSLPAEAVSNGPNRYPTFASTLPKKSTVVARLNGQRVGTLETDEHGRALVGQCLTTAAPPPTPP